MDPRAPSRTSKGTISSDRTISCPWTCDRARIRAPVLALQARRITAGSAPPVDASEDPPRGHPHVIGIYNDRHWVHNRFNYKVVATCVPANAPPCRRPKGIAAGDRAGNGICINATDDAGSYDAFKTNGVCSCSDGWGDVGCDKNLTRLTIGRSQTATVPVGEWAFFDVVVEAPPSYGLDPEIAMLVELRRTSGDPVALS